MYIADSVNNVVREVSSGGIISTVAGSGTIGYGGDGQLATASSVRLNHPVGLAVNAAGDLLFSDSENNVVRKVSLTTGLISTVAGNAGLTSPSGDGADATATFAGFNKVGQIALEPSGTILLTDQFNFRIRQVNGSVGALSYQPVKETNPSPPQPQSIENDGNAPLTVSSIVAGTNAKVGSTTCVDGQAIAVGSGCTVEAVFQPQTVGSPVIGSIAINSDSAVTPVTIVVAGQSLSIFPTQTVLSVTPNPAGLGAGVTMTAVVSNTGGTSNTVSLAQANAPNPPAVVTFYDTVGGTTTQIGTPQQIGGSTAGQGTATLVYSGLALGNHSITAVYAGDAEDATSTSSAVAETIDQQTSLLLNGSPGPTATVFQNITFTATVTPTNSGGTTPTGVVNFSADGVAFAGNVTLNGSGVASASDATLSQGRHVITASYTGDGSNLPSTGSYTETVGLATATITLGTSANSALVTQPITFTATLTGVNGNTPSGNVVFADTFNGATTTIGTVAVNPATSTAVLANYTALAVGSNHSITATYQGDGTNYGASAPSNAVGETINQVPTMVSLNPTNGTGVAGGSTSYSVLVTANSATNGVVALTGGISLTTSGGAVLGNGTLVPVAGSNPAQAAATIKITNGKPGNVPVTATYGGATDYAGSSAGGALLLTQATTTTSLTPTTQTISATQTATITAAVNSVNGGIPTGTVSFTDTSTGTTYPSVTLNSSGNAALRVSTLTVGTHTFVASYSGDANDNPSGPSAPVTVTVNAVQPTMTLSPSANPTLNGQAFSLTANVVTGLGSDTATGSVTFTDSVVSDPAVTVPLTNGSATFSSSTLTDGVHTFTVSYPGDANNLPVTKTLSVTVLQTATLVVTGNAAGPIAARQSVTFTATLTPLQQVPASGSIVFKSNGVVIGTQALTNDVATLTTTTLPVGTDQITASYTSDGFTQSITSGAYTQVVNADGVTLTVVASSNPATFGAPLTLTATGAGTNGPLTGTVQFNDTFAGATSTIGTGTFSSGIATATTTALQPGVHSVVAAYQGDANDSPATSAAVSFSVKRLTTTVVTATPNPQLSVAPVTVTATVANSTTTAFATGVVTFFDGTTQVGTGTLNGSGVATLTLQSLAVGAHSFTAQYAGDALNLPSTSANPFAETVGLRQTTTDLSTTASSLTGGQQLTLISVVHSLGGPVVPTGQVVFYTGSAVLATQTLDGNGVATVTVLLTTPTAALTAVYSGDANYASSTSAVDNVTLGPAPDFNLVVTPSTISVVQTQHTTVSLNLSSVKNFTDTLQLGCVGLPTAATCTFAQNGKTVDAVTLAAGGTQTVSLTIDTGNPLQAGAQASVQRADRPGATSGMTSSMVLSCALPGCFLLGLLGMRQRRFRNLGGLLLLCLAGASAALSGCASLNINGTPTGTYTFRVTAVGQTGISQATSVTLTVTQ